MRVKDLIDLLEKVEDKDLDVVVLDAEYVANEPCVNVDGFIYLGDSEPADAKDKIPCVVITGGW